LRHDGSSEGDGWILSYIFDESQLGESRNAPSSGKSKLWIVNAKDMKTVVSRTKLPHRVPYGLHGD
jgi:carotenoid cleavage dioxygenase-like enzyme